MGSGEQYWSWISIDDVVGGIEFLLDHEVSGPVNLTGPEPVTNAEFTKALGSVLHRPTFLPVPKFGPRLILGRELADTLLAASQRALPKILQGAGYTFRHATCGPPSPRCSTRSRSSPRRPKRDRLRPGRLVGSGPWSSAST